MTPLQKLDSLIDYFTPIIRDAFLEAIADVVSNTVINSVISAIEAGDVVAAFQALNMSQAAMRPISAALETAFETGGVMTGQTFPKFINTSNGRGVFRFDVRNSRAEAYLRDKSSTLITNITEDARVNVASVLTDGMQRGLNPRNVALDIVGRIDPTTGKRSGGIVGLNQQQEYWVRSTRDKLQTLDGEYFNLSLRDKRFDKTVQKAMRDGKPLDNATIEKLVSRYKDNALKYRGETIGRTEAMQSLNASEYEAVKQAVELGATQESAVRRHWDSAGDTRVRPEHVALDQKYAEEGVGLNEPFVAPGGAQMLYPGDTSLGAGAGEVVDCRCRARTAVDWLLNVD